MLHILLFSCQTMKVKLRMMSGLPSGASPHSGVPLSSRMPRLVDRSLSVLNQTVPDDTRSLAYNVNPIHYKRPCPVPTEPSSGVALLGSHQVPDSNGSASRCTPHYQQPHQVSNWRHFFRSKCAAVQQRAFLKGHGQHSRQPRDRTGAGAKGHLIDAARRRAG